MWPLGDLPIDPESVGGHEQVWLQLAIDERGDVGDNNDDGIDANDHHKGHDDKEPSLNYYSAAVRLPTDTTESLLPVWVPAHPSASRTGLTLVVKMERNDVEEGNPDARCGPLRVTIQPDPHPAVLVHNTWSTPATVQLTLHEEDVGVGRTKREKVHPLSQPAATVLSVHTPDRGQNPRTKSNRSLGPVAQVCVPARGGRQALDVPSMLAPPATSASEGERLWLWNQARLSALAVATDGSVGPRHPSQFSFFSRPRAATQRCRHVGGFRGRLLRARSAAGFGDFEDHGYTALHVCVLRPPRGRASRPARWRTARRPRWCGSRWHTPA